MQPTSKLANPEPTPLAGKVIGIVLAIAILAGVGYLIYTSNHKSDTKSPAKAVQQKEAAHATDQVMDTSGIITAVKNDTKDGFGKQGDVVVIDKISGNTATGSVQNGTASTGFTATQSGGKWTVHANK